jgi:hypothetical protein
VRQRVLSTSLLYGKYLPIGEAMPSRYQVSEQRLVRRVYNRITGRGVGIDRPGVYRLVGIERLRIFPWLVRVDRSRRILYRFIRSRIGTRSRVGTIGAVLVLGILRMGFHKLYSEDLQSLIKAELGLAMPPDAKGSLGGHLGEYIFSLPSDIPLLVPCIR